MEIKEEHLPQLTHIELKYKSNKYLNNSFNQTIIDELERNDERRMCYISVKTLTTKELKELSKAVNQLIRNQEIFLA